MRPDQVQEDAVYENNLRRRAGGLAVWPGWAGVWISAHAWTQKNFIEKNFMNP